MGKARDEKDAPKVKGNWGPRGASGQKKWVKETKGCDDCSWKGRG